MTAFDLINDNGAFQMLTDYATGEVSPTTAVEAFLAGSGVNVATFGAAGDGVTDDTAAITAAIAAMPAEGGTLYFPAGTYVTTGGFTIAVPCTIRGEGASGLADAASSQVTLITCTSDTASLFTVTADVARFETLGMRNDAVAPVSAGAAVTVNGNTEYQRVDFEGVVVSGGFWIGVDVRNGSHWTMHACHIEDCVKYGLKIANASNQDEGDFAISDCWFQQRLVVADAAIRIEGAGGGHISNTRINGFSTNYVTGIDLFVLDATQTGELYLSQVFIVAFSGDGLRASYEGNLGLWTKISLTGCLIVTYNATTTSRAIRLTGQTYGIGYGFAGVTITGCQFAAGDGARAAALLTNCSLVTMTGNQVDGTYFTSVAEFAEYSDRIYDGTGGIGESVYVSGVPSAGMVPVAVSATTATWVVPAWYAYATYAQTITRLPDLAGYWRLGEPSGTSAVDAGPNGLTGTYVNTPTLGVTGLLTGDADTAVTFTAASTEYVNVGSNAAIDFAGDFTIVLWLKVASAPASPQRLFAKRNAGVWGYEMVLEADGKPGLLIGDGAVYTQYTLTDVSVTDNVRHCIVGQRSGQDIVGYVDGVLTHAPQATLVGDTSGSGATAAIGYLIAYATGAFNGTLDEVAVFDRTLSPIEVEMIYRVGTGT